MTNHVRGLLDLSQESFRQIIFSTYLKFDITFSTTVINEMP